MTHTPSPTVKEDREAAADLFAGTPWSRHQFLSGKRDHQSKVQAFVAHRELGERRAAAAHHRHLVADPIDPSLEGNPGCA